MAARLSLAGTRAEKSRFGLILQGAVAPTLGENRRFEGNTEPNEVEGGNLPVPPPP